MFYQTESKPQGWRAVAVFDDRTDRLLYLGRSSTQVQFGQAFFEVLDEEFHCSSGWHGASLAAPNQSDGSHESQIGRSASCSISDVVVILSPPAR